MKYKIQDFNKEYYQCWKMGLMIPNPKNYSTFNVKFYFDGNKSIHYSRICLNAYSPNDALERACYLATFQTQYRPEDVNLEAVYDAEENLLWIDEPYYDVVQKKYEFRGMERREFILRFGATAAAILYGFYPGRAKAGTTSVSLNCTASGFTIPTGQQIYPNSGSFTWSCPAGVSTCSVMGVGGGANGGGWGGNGGGGSFILSSFASTPGTNYSVSVGASGGGGTSFHSTSCGGGTGGQCHGAGGSAGPGGYTGGQGGDNLNPSAGVSAGGGAAGYGGNGGYGGSGYGGNAGGAGQAGQGGGAGGGGGAADVFSGGGGGGASIYGGTGGSGGYGGTNGPGGGAGGAGGSGYGGTAGDNGSNGGTSNVSGYVIPGGLFGGSGAGSVGPGGNGAVRIIWGPGKSYPNNALNF